MASKDMFEAALSDEGVSGTLADVARSIYMQESSGGKRTNTSNAGAMGGMQIIPSTFNSVADKGWDINDPSHNARAGIRYLGQMFKKAGGDPALTAAGYYGGPGGLEKARAGVAVSDPRNPNAPNTLEYGQQVAARMGKGTITPEQDAPVVLPVAPNEVQQVQLAQAPVAPVTSPAWQGFQQAMPNPVQANDMNYGPSLEIPKFGAPMLASARNPNFSAFGRWKGKA